MPSAASGVIFNRYLKLAAETGPEVMGAIAETCHAIENDVKGGPHAAPIRTGNLRRSYHTTLEPAKMEGEIGADMSIAPYAGFVEFGTSRMAPRPHLTPASEAQREKHTERVIAAVRAAMARARGL